MTISIKNIMNNLSPYYRLKLIAGKNGIDNTNVSWVSTVEDFSSGKFKNHNQIILTSFMNNYTEEAVLAIVHGLHEAMTSAVVVNTRYIKTMPDSIKEYCDKAALPLYIMPPDIFMSDVIKDISRILYSDENENLSLSEIIQSIVFNTGDIQSQINKLSFYGFSENSTYCPVILKFENAAEKEPELFLKKAKQCCDSAAQSADAKHISFIYNRIITIILSDMDKKAIGRLINTIKENLLLKYIEHKVYICVGRLGGNIYSLSTNFKRVLPFFNVAIKNNLYSLYYDDMGIYKILSEVSDMQILREMFNSSIGALARYDAENDTNLVCYIKSYIQFDGNAQALAEKFYVHRNTVNNHLKKIKEITKINPSTLEGKLPFAVAIKISELYNL